MFGAACAAVGFDALTTVRAFVRDAAKAAAVLPPPSARLEIVRGDLASARDVAAACAGEVTSSSGPGAPLAAVRASCGQPPRRSRAARGLLLGLGGEHHD